MSAVNKSYIFLAAVGIIGIYSLLSLTKHGIGIGVDSVTYIGGAINLLSGNGYNIYTLAFNGENRPITIYPPFFSMVLAFLGLLHIEPIEGARLINSLFFGANILLAGLIINRVIYGSIWLLILASLLILSSTNMLAIHCFAWTEPMFIFFSVLGLYLLSLYVDNSKVIFLIFSSFSIAMGLLTRYAGIAPIISGIIGILLLRKGNWYKNTLYSFIFFIISILPISIWIIRNKYLYSDSVGRQFAYHPVGQKAFKEIITVISSWLLPSELLSTYLSELLLISLFIILSIAIYYMIKDSYKGNSDNKLGLLFSTTPLMFFIYFITYIPFILFSRSFFDAHLPMNNRIFSPLFIPFIIILFYIIYKNLIYYKHRYYIRYIFYAFCILLVAVNMAQGTKWALIKQKDGEGYSSAYWINSDTLKYIDKVASGIIFSNACDAIYIVTGKKCYPLPFKYDPTSLEKNKRYLYEMAFLKGHLEHENAVLCWLDELSWRKYLPSEEELKKELNLKLIDKFNDGKIYGIIE